jgi:predicted secreted protein
MAANLGRAVTFEWGDASPQTEIPGVRETGVNLNGEAIDVTANDSVGWREVLAAPAENQVDISLSGVTKDKTLRSAWFSGTPGARLQDVTLTYADGASFTGKFYLQSYNETAAYNDAVAFEAELVSSGAIAYTAGA